MEDGGRSSHDPGFLKETVQSARPQNESISHSDINKLSPFFSPKKENMGVRGGKDEYIGIGNSYIPLCIK